MQHVFDNPMTAHVWAAQTQDSGRSNNGQFYFEGRALYSYGKHYCAGYVAPGPLYLINGDSNSVTTNRHVSYARRAVPRECREIPNLTEIARIFESAEYSIEALGQKPGPVWKDARQSLARAFGYRFSDLPPVSDMVAILRAAGATKAEAEATAKRVNKKTRKTEAARVAAEEKRETEKLLNVAGALAEVAPEVNGKKARDLLQSVAGESQYSEDRVRDDVAAKGQLCHRAAVAAKGRGWVAIAKTCRAHHSAIRAAIREFESGRERMATRNRIRGYIETIRDAESSKPGDSDHAMARHYKTVAAAAYSLAQSVFVMVAGGKAMKDRLLDVADTAQKFAAEHEALAAAARMAEQAAARAEWRATGKRPDYRIGQLSDESGGALLRAADVTRDESGAITGGNLETSHSAHVPLVHAIRAFQFVKLCREHARPWAANGQTIRVGHFRIDSIDSAGNFRAGCHSINWPEIEALAASLGVLDLAPADTTERR